MQAWPSHRKLLAAALLFAPTALAQDVPRPHALGAAPRAASAAVGHWSPASRATIPTARALPVSSRRWWYEDYPRSRVIFPEHRYLHPIAPPAEEDFSPVSMKWSLSGRRPMLPTVEIAGMDTWSPDTWHVPDPAQQYGHFQSSRTPAALGAKIKRLVLAQLKY